MYVQSYDHIHEIKTHDYIDYVICGLLSSKNPNTFQDANSLTRGDLIT